MLCADRCDAFGDDFRRRGVVLADGRPNPSVSEVRQQQVTLARLISTLRLPEDLTRPQFGPQRRGSARGVYHLSEGTKHREDAAAQSTRPRPRSR